METLELLEEQLLAYSGTLLLVSHDREFLDNVVTSTFVLEGDGQVRCYPGGYEDYLRQRPMPVRANAKVEKTAETNRREAAFGPRKLSYGEKREFDALPSKIDALEKEVAELRETLSSGDLYRTDPVRAQATATRLPEAEAELDAAVERWAELGERAGV